MKTKRQQSARKLAAAVLALALAVSAPAYAAETRGSVTTSAAGDALQRFTDVTSQHWAIKHVTKLAALGIIEGYEKNEYRPENSVTQQEVIVMALRMMGLEDEVLKNKAELVLPFEVSDYAKPYIAYALDEGLIVTTEELEGTTAKAAWGTREATREWVAKLVIRAIDKDGLADEQAGDSPVFKDAEELSSWAVGYVNAAVDLGLVQGFEDNTFQPQGKVTRAQMATFLSRADREMASGSDKSFRGYVMELKDRKLTLLDEQGSTKQFSLPASIPMFSGKDDSAIELSKIKLTNEVYVVNGTGGVTYLELTNEEEKMEVFEGTLNEIFLDQMIVSLQQGTQKKLYELSPSVSVTDGEGHGLSLGSLAPGSIVHLKRNTLLKETHISHIVLKQAPVSKSAEGTIKSISTTDGLVTFTETASGKEESYTISLKTSVKLADGTASDVTKLRVGDSVAYDVKSNELVSVNVRKQADSVQLVEGTMASFSEDKRILTITQTGETALGAYYLADNAVVDISGLTNPSFYDIEVGDVMKLELVNNKISRVTVTSRSVKQYEYASIIGYDADSKILTVNSDTGVGAYRMTEQTSIKYQNSATTMPLSNFQSLFITNNGSRKARVNLKVSKDRVVQIEMTQYIDGTVAQINTSSVPNEITIRTAGGQSHVFKITSGLPIELLNKTAAQLSDLRVGDSVRATLTFTQDYVTALSMRKSGLYKVVVTDSSSKQVTVKDESGTSFSFIADNNDKIINPGQSTHVFTDIKADEYVTASFNGTKLDTLTIQQALRGKVTAVDLAAESISVQSHGGGVQLIPIGSKVTVKRNGATIATSLSGVKVDDRAEIVKDAAGNYVIVLAASSKRTVSSYESVLNQMVFKASGSEKTTFNIHPKAYLQKGGQSTGASSFTENEEVNLFVVDDKIIEIEKP